MANYKTLPKSKVNFTLKVDKTAIENARKTVIQHMKNQISIKGFRKGHAPDDYVVAQVGVQKIAFEAMNQAIDKAYANFIKENNLQVISQPEVDIPSPDSDPIEVKCEVEIYPEITVGDYKKIKVKKEKIEVETKEIEDVLMTVCAQMEAGEEVKRAAKKNDLVEVDFAGIDDKGKEIPNTAGKNMTFRLGQGHYLPDLEKAFEGMKAGEEKKAVKVKFPKDYHSEDFAGKIVNFDVAVHKVSEINPNKLTKEQIQQISGKEQSLDELKESIKKTITQNKTQAKEQEWIADYSTQLAKLVKADLPQSWLDREVSSRLARLKQNPQFQSNPEQFWKAMGKDEEVFKKELASEGEKDLKVFLGLSEIVKTEGITLDKDEKTQAHHIARQNIGHDHHHGHSHDVEVEKAELNLKIDKFLRSTIIEG